MSFSSLPQELVDHIAFCIGVSGKGQDKVFNVKNLVNFCLVSKQTASSARAALYRRPFAWPRSLPGQHTFGSGPYNADSLLGALEANGCALGRLVRETLGIYEWLYTPGDNTQIRRWYCGVLRACPNLRQVDLHFPTQTELKDLLQNVTLSDRTTPQNFPFHSTLPSASPTSRLQCLDFNDLYWNLQQGQRLHISDVFTTFGRFALSSLDTVYFTRFYWSKEDNGSTPLFPFAIKHLHIRTRKEYLADSIALSSRFPSNLKTFTLSSFPDEGTIDLTPCTTHHGSHLRKLALQLTDYQAYNRLQLSKSATSLPDVKIVLEGLRSYPLLTSLTLSGTHGPSLRFLSKLAEFSPLLRILDLTNSRWISDSNPLSTIHNEIFPETRVPSALGELKQLVDVHLGLLPTVNGERYEYVVTALKSRGVKVRFDCCVEDESE